MTSNESIPTKEIITVAAVSLVLLALLSLRSDLLFPTHEMYDQNWQHHQYVHASEIFPEISNEAPFCWRLLPPAIVRYSPFAVHTSYFLLSFISLWGASIILYLILFRLGYDRVFRWFGLLLFASAVYAVRMNLIEFAAVDPPAFLFMTLAIYAALRKRRWLFILATILGVLSKELVFAVLPLWFTINRTESLHSKKSRRLFIEATAVGLPALLTYAVLRLLIVPENGHEHFLLILGAPKFRLDTFLGTFYTLNKPLIEDPPQVLVGAINMYRLTLGALGPLLLLMLYGFRYLQPRLSQYWPFIALIILQVFIAYDHERLIAAGFPAFIILTVHVSQAITQRKHLRTELFLLLSALLYTSQLFMVATHYQQTYYSVVVQTIITAGFILLVMLRSTPLGTRLLKSSF